MNNRPAVLFLCQRLPFPPNKGEKITSFNLVRHLGQRFDVHVGTFVDTPEDVPEIEGLRPYCASLHVGRIAKPWAWVPAGLRWLAGMPLSFAIFRSAGLKAYVRAVIDQHQPIAVVTHSSNISHYALTPTPRRTVRVFHFADVDFGKVRCLCGAGHGLETAVFDPRGGPGARGGGAPDGGRRRGRLHLR